MSNILDLTKEFESIEELRIFAEAQLKQILQLNKQVKELTEQKEHAEQLLKAINPVTVKNNEDTLKNMLKVENNDAKIIAQIQLKFLKDKAMGDELNMDEAKRVEIYNKILNIETDKGKEKEDSIKDLPETELLKLVTNGPSGK